MTTNDLAAIGAEMRAKADAEPWNPLTLRPPDRRYMRQLDVEGYRFWITLTRTNTTTRSLYVLSIGEPALLPETVVQQVRAAIVPNSTELGESIICRQFVQCIEKGATP